MKGLRWLRSQLPKVQPWPQLARWHSQWHCHTSLIDLCDTDERMGVRMCSNLLERMCVSVLVYVNVTLRSLCSNASLSKAQAIWCPLSEHLPRYCMQEPRLSVPRWSHSSADSNIRWLFPYTEDPIHTKFTFSHVHMFRSSFYLTSFTPCTPTLLSSEWVTMQKGSK